MTHVPETQQRVKFYQTGTFTVGNRLLDDARRTVQASVERSNSLDSGHRACQGCGEALGARYAVDAACARPKARSSPPTRPGVSKCSPRPIHRPPGDCRGYIRCSATWRRWAPGSPRRSRPRDARTSGSSPRAVTAAPPISASAACRACSIATTTCSTSATTTRPT